MAAFDTNAFATTAFDANAFDFGAVASTPAIGVVSYGAAGGGSGVRRERKAGWSRLLNEALREPTKKVAKAPSLTKREREINDEIDRLIASTASLPAAPTPAAPVATPATASVVPRSPLVVAVAHCPPMAAMRAVPVRPDYGGDVVVQYVTIAPIAVRPVAASGIHNLSDDEFTRIALLAHELSQPKLPDLSQ